MQKHPTLTLKRAQLFAGPRGLASRLYPEHAPVRLFTYAAPDRITYEEAMQGQYRPAQVGEQFGPFWATHWFRVEIDIPTAWAGKEVHFLWDSTSEGEVYIDGQPMQGLTGSGLGWGPIDGPTRPEYVLTQKAKGGESLVLYDDMAFDIEVGSFQLTIRDGVLIPSLILHYKQDNAVYMMLENVEIDGMSLEGEGEAYGEGANGAFGKGDRVSLSAECSLPQDYRDNKSPLTFDINLYDAETDELVLSVPVTVLRG